jgi:hypothetical protein
MDYSKVKLKKKLVDIKNLDKGGWVEKWTQHRTKDIANFPHPARICLCGPPSCGKSFYMKQMILHQRPMFQELYIIHGDADCTKEFDDLDPTMMLREFPPIEFWDGEVKTLVIIDDVEFSNLSKEQSARLNKLLRYGSSHKNLTCFVSHQSFFDLPNLVRKLCNVFILWKPRSVMELKIIANRVGYTAKEIEYIFENICNKYRDSLCIDLTANSPAELRKNLWQVIDPSEVPKLK